MKILYSVCVMVFLAVCVVGCYSVSESNKIVNYDVSSISGLAAELNRGTNLETITTVVEWVYFNIDYKSEDLYDCSGASAEDVLKRGWGDCSGMSKLTAALLRANDIPAEVSIGCASDQPKRWDFCKTVLFAAVPPEEVPAVMGPKVRELEFADGKPLISGGAHAWVKAWGNTGWVYVEPTSGEVIDTTCPGYRYYYTYDEVSRPDSVCVIDFGPYYENKKVYDDFVAYCSAF